MVKPCEVISIGMILKQPDRIRAYHIVPCACLGARPPQKSVFVHDSIVGLDHHSRITNIGEDLCCTRFYISLEKRFCRISKAVNDLAFPVRRNRLNIKMRHRNTDHMELSGTGVEPHQLASWGGSLLIQVM